MVFLGQKATTDFRPDISDKNYTFDDVQGVSLLFLFLFPLSLLLVRGLKGKTSKKLACQNRSNNTLGWSLTRCTCTQSLVVVASAISEILSLSPSLCTCTFFSLYRLMKLKLKYKRWLSFLEILAGLRN